MGPILSASFLQATPPGPGTDLCNTCSSMPSVWVGNVLCRPQAPQVRDHLLQRGAAVTCAKDSHLRMLPERRARRPGTGQGLQRAPGLQGPGRHQERAVRDQDALLRLASLVSCASHTPASAALAGALAAAVVAAASSKPPAAGSTGQGRPEDCTQFQSSVGAPATSTRLAGAAADLVVSAVSACGPATLSADPACAAAVAIAAASAATASARLLSPDAAMADAVAQILISAPPLPNDSADSSGVPTCNVCGKPLPCDEPCPLAVAATALRGLHLRKTYATGRKWTAQRQLHMHSC